MTTRFGPDEHRQHVAARAREIDERDLLRGKRAEQLREVARAQIGAGNADLRILALAAAVADEHEHDLIARARARRELRRARARRSPWSTVRGSAAASRRCPRRAR